MAKYGTAAAKSVKSAMHREKKGTLKSGSGRTVTNPKQAIAIGLNEARAKGAKVPPPPASRKTAKGGRKGATRAGARKGAVKKGASKAARKTSAKKK